MKKAIPQFLILILFALFIFLGRYIDNWPEWTGFGEREIVDGIEPAKNLWDWLDLIMVPLILGVVAWYLGKTEKEIDRRREQERYQQENINKYLDLMTNLLLKEKLKSNPENPEVKILARTQTLRLFRESDRGRKVVVLQFLFESGLIFKDPVVNLNGADLEDADLDGIILRGVSIKGAYFSKTSLKDSKLDESDFSASDFNSANLSNSTFEGTILRYANFVNSKIRNCDLRKANLEGADFTNADLKNTHITNEQYKLIINKNIKHLKISVDE